MIDFSWAPQFYVPFEVVYFGAAIILGYIFLRFILGLGKDEPNNVHPSMWSWE